jgi:prepilin peptidase dependent protein B
MSTRQPTACAPRRPLRASGPALCQKQTVARDCLRLGSAPRECTQNPWGGPASGKVAAQRGLSLVELLVGLALGLLVLAAGAMLLTQQLREHRALLLEARLMQDLRTATDLVARDLRRAGHWGDAAAGVGSPTQAPRANPYAALAPAAAASDAASFAYSRDVTENHLLDNNEQFGFRLRNRAIELQLGRNNWQALTDATLLAVTGFSITPTIEEIDLGALCHQPCAAGSATCPPRQQVRSFAVLIAGNSLADASVTRGVQAVVRVRYDAVVGACPV